jgi:hypothetical protein
MLQAIATIAVPLCMAPVTCFAQQSSHKLSDYAGTWQADFHGTRFITIKLVEKGGHLTGSTSFGDIKAAPNGEIKRVEAPEGPESPSLIAICFGLVAWSLRRAETIPMTPSP